MLSLRESAKPGARERVSCKSNSRIFCINPTKQCTAFFRVGRYECDASRWWEKRDGSRVYNLEEIKTDSVGQQRQQKESRQHRSSTPGGIPVKEQRFGGKLRRYVSHRGGVAASATDLMPCSRAAFVTSATVS